MRYHLAGEAGASVMSYEFIIIVEYRIRIYYYYGRNEFSRLETQFRIHVRSQHSIYDQSYYLYLSVKLFPIKYAMHEVD